MDMKSEEEIFVEVYCHHYFLLKKLLILRIVIFLL